MVEILHYETANKNKTIGYADVRVPILKPTILIFRKVAHIQSGDRRWFTLPSFSRDRADGSPSYLKYMEFETAVYNDQLLGTINDRVKEYCDSRGIKGIEPIEFNAFPDPSDNELPF